MEQVKMAKVLIIDDDRIFCEVMLHALKDTEHQVSTALTLQDGLKKAKAVRYDVIYLDIRLPDGNGLDSLPVLLQGETPPEIIVVSGLVDIESAEIALKHGAWDYISKPTSLELVLHPLFRALQYREAKFASKARPIALKRERIAGNGPEMRHCLDLVAQAAASEVNVLITGETGTGKELFASAIHQNSSRQDRNFVIVDCAVLTENLIESILFGHEKGAFTGADRSREGLVLHADRGTLFLDEIGELPLPVQKTFLRVLEERSFRPLGSRKVLTSDFRLIAATNCDLGQMVAEGRFRKDLLFRLQTLTINLPALRGRSADIREIARFHITRLCERYGMEMKGFSPEFLEALTAYSWPGNNRELVNTLERTLAVARHEPTLFPKHLPVEVRMSLTQKSFPTEARPEKTRPEELKIDQLCSIKEFRKEMDAVYLQNLLNSTGRDAEKAWRISGLSRSHFYALLKDHGIKLS